ncbi:MAG: hypothetical protein ACYDBQ_12045 [Thermoplasmatota archaeon]
MAFSKFSPHAPVDLPVDPSARNRAWLLRWGWWVSEGMVWLGVLFMLSFLGWRWRYILLAAALGVVAWFLLRLRRQ